MSDWGQQPPGGPPTTPPQGGGQPPYGGGPPPGYPPPPPPGPGGPYGGAPPPGYPPPPPSGPGGPYGGPPGGPYGGGPYGGPPRRGGTAISGRTLVAIGVALALVVGLVVGALLVAGGDDDEDVAAGDEEGEVFLEPVASTTDPFTDSVAAALPPGGPSTTAAPAPTGRGANAIQSVQGSRPGLYGGTRSETSCDRGQLVRFLQDNAEMGRAWSDVLDIEFADIETYVDSLTPVLLQQDTRVTNHGYRNGHATVINSVLQTGTAVLVDQYGEPAVRCYCGNPLRRPVALRRPHYTGSRWSAFSERSITVVQRTTVVIQQFILVDWRTGQPFTRPVGTDGTDDADAPGTTTTTTAGPSTTTTTVRPPPATTPTPPPAPAATDLQVSLSWSTTDDMDLSVTDPSGETASLSGGTSSGGNLDQDANRGCSGGASPVETASWPPGSAPPGRYGVTVTYYATCGDGAPVTFTVTATSGGQVVSSVTDTLSPDESREVASFTL